MNGRCHRCVGRVRKGVIDVRPMCDARRVTSEPACSSPAGTTPDMAALAKVVARQRAEMDRLRDQAATEAVLERAKGVLMALSGCTPDAAGEDLQRRAKAANRTLIEECWITLGSLVPPLPGADPSATPCPPSPHLPVRRPSGRSPCGRDTSDTDDGFAVLARLGRSLAHVVSPHDLAGCLLEELAAEVDADALLIFRSRPTGGLSLIGHMRRRRHPGHPMGPGPPAEWHHRA